MTSPHRRPGRARAARLAFPLVVAFAGCLGPSSEVEVDEDQLLELYTTTATYLYEDGSLIRAQDQAVKALEIDPENRPMRRMIGWIRLRMGSTADLVIAERMFRDLVDDGDENDGTLLGLATALERLGVAHDEASQAWASGERRPRAGEDPAERARELAKRARDLWAESLATYRRTLKNGEGSIRAMNGLQRVTALLGDYEASLAWSKTLLERSDAELSTWRRFLTVADLTEREEELFRTNEESAVELQTNTHLFAATLLHRLGRRDEALAHLDAVATLSPDLAQVYSLRAQLREAMGDCEHAIEDIDRYLRLSDQPFEDPEVRQAFELRTLCEGRLREAAAER
jgi:tetratricopeptide (TPR) repeat protein